MWLDVHAQYQGFLAAFTLSWGREKDWFITLIWVSEEQRSVSEFARVYGGLGGKLL
jgi:hypothetical protein